MCMIDTAWCLGGLHKFSKSKTIEHYVLVGGGLVDHISWDKRMLFDWQYACYLISHAEGYVVV